MNWFFNGVEHPLVEALGWTLLHFVWQGAAVAALLAGGLVALRGHSAEARYIAACAALALMALLPPATLAWCWRTNAHDEARLPTASERPLPGDPVSEMGRGRSSVRFPADNGSALDPAADGAEHRGEFEIGRAEPVAPTSGAGWSERLRAAVPWLVIGWFAGVLCLSLRLLAVWLRVQRLRRVSTVPPPAGLSAVGARLAARMRVSRPVRLLVSALIEVPSVIGWLRPVILLPATALTGLDAMQLEGILAHELAHVRRGDYLVNLIQNVIETLLFYHPAVWWVSSKIRQERENCCDDVAAALCGDRAVYVAALVQMESLRGSARQLALAATGGSLVARARRLLHPNRPDRLPVWWPAGALSLGVLVLALAGLWRVAGADGPRPDDELQATVAAAPAADVNDEELTPSTLADRIEKAIHELDSVEYTAEVAERRNAAAFGRDNDPLWVDGKGRYRYRSDGVRWFIDEHGFTFNSGVAEAIPTHVTSAFDGKLHVHTGQVNGAVVLGEDDLSYDRLNPGKVFWVSDHLLTSLRRPEARIVGREEILGQACIVVEQELKTNNGEFRLEAALAPGRSYLPLRFRTQFNGVDSIRQSIDSLRQTPDGFWYPDKITHIWHRITPRRTVQITALTRRAANNPFAAADFHFDIPAGVDVVDRRRAIAWHNDPWWNELAPWIKEKFNWPTPTYTAPEVASYCDPSMDGKAAPVIDAAEWINGDASNWKRKGRVVTLLYFFGGRSIDPHPQLVAALKAWHRRLGDKNVDLVGIATAATPELTKLSVRELEIDFPVAIDKPSDGTGFGKTFEAFRMKSYSGILVIDHVGRVHTVGGAGAPGEPFPTAVMNQLRAAGVKPNEGGAAEGVGPRQLDHQAIEAEWKRVMRAGNGTARVRGRTLLALTAGAAGRDEQDASEATPVGATIRLVPELRLLNSNTPGGWLVIFDAERAVEVKSNSKTGEFKIEGLRKGTYVATLTAAGLAIAEREVVVADDDSAVDLTVKFRNRGTLAGRVVDGEGNPIAGATVRATLRHFDPSAPQRTTTAHLPAALPPTDDDGQFRFEKLYEGSFTLEASAPGYKPATVARVLPTSQAVEIVLEKAAAKE